MAFDVDFKFFAKKWNDVGVIGLQPFASEE